MIYLRIIMIMVKMTIQNKWKMELKKKLQSMARLIHHNKIRKILCKKRKKKKINQNRKQNLIIKKM